MAGARTVLGLGSVVGLALWRSAFYPAPRESCGCTRAKSGLGTELN